MTLSYGVIFGWHFSSVLWFNGAFADLYAYPPVTLPHRFSSTVSLILSGLLLFAVTYRPVFCSDTDTAP